jgi:hypothetical protein
MGDFEPMTSTADRRRSKRREHVVDAYIISPTATNPYERREVTSINLSRHGVAFDFVQPLPKGSYYNICVGLGDQQLTSEIRIVACQPIEDGLYQVGAEFC